MKDRIVFAGLLALLVSLLALRHTILAETDVSPLLRNGDLPAINQAGDEPAPMPIDDVQAQPVGTPDSDQPRIIGGEAAPPGAWPWMAAIVDSSYSNIQTGWYCGGALIHSEWVLTAAHCTMHYVNGEPLPPSAIDVAVGKHRLSDDSGERIKVTKIIRHPNYDDYTYNYDLALLHLAEASTHVPIDLVPFDDTALTAPGTMALVIGWGDTRAGGIPGNYADVLQQVTVPIVSNQTCNSASSYGGSVTENMLCAGLPEGGKDACAGDSGGPLMVPDNGGGWLHGGIVSWGYDCAQPNYYGVYTRISRFSNWIDEQIMFAAIPTPTPTPTATPTAIPTPTPTATPAAGEISDLRISNVRDTSFSISWLTETESGGALLVATDPAKLRDNPLIFQVQGRSQAHQVTATDLAPSTTYFFYVRSGSHVDDNHGVYYTVTTGPTLTLPVSDTIYGQVLHENGSTAGRCTILAEVVDKDVAGSEDRSALLSTRTDASGNWSLNLGNARLHSLAGYFIYTTAGDAIALEVQCDPSHGAATTVTLDTGDQAPDVAVQPLNRQIQTLGSGWELIALPYQTLGAYTADRLCADLRRSTPGAAVEIVRWTADGWSGYICGVDANNFTLVPSEAYFVRSLAPTTWFLTGLPFDTTPAPEAQPGWNSVNPARWGSASAADLCATVAAPDQALEVNRWLAGGWEGHVCALGFNDFAFDRGAGYFLKVAAGTGAAARAAPIQRPDVPAGAASVSDLRLTNLRDGSVAISWRTTKPSDGYVVYSVDSTLVGVVYDVRGEQKQDTLHYAVLTDLLPETTYHFRAISRGEGGAYSEGSGQFTTLATLGSVPRSQSAYGRVFQENSITPAPDALVLLTLIDADNHGSSGRSRTLSTLTDGNGYWYANFGNARTQSGEPFQFDAADQVEIVAIYPGAAATTVTVPVDATFPAAPITTTPAQFYLPIVRR